MVIEDVPIENRAHSLEDLDKMLEYVHKKQADRPGFITPYALELQIITAMRRGEIPAIKWSDIDDECITIQREMLTVKDPDGGKGRYEIVEHTKTYKNRKYPLTKDLTEFLDRLRKAHELARV